MATTLRFPKTFCFGTATAAFQIEGADKADGKGRSIWDDYCADRSNIIDRSDATLACDHYRRFRDDVALMERLGYRHYRFSIGWPRVFPDGVSFNAAGFAFYDRLVDALLAAGITPYATLYHWDLPSALQDRGGWTDRDTAYRFADYAAETTRRLGDRVTNWMTHNEPWVAAFVGNLFGDHAPGKRDLAQALASAHHILLSHGLAVPQIRAGAPSAQVGIVHNLEWVEPASRSERDVAAAVRHDGAFNRWFLDSVLRGAYPQDMLAWYGDAMVDVQPDDLATIAAPIDFLGVNYYTRRVIAHDDQGGFIQTRQKQYPFVPRAQYEKWENNPEGLYRVLIRLKDEYGNVPLLITENGTPLEQDAVVDGVCADPERIAYLKNHFAAAWQAIEDGVDLRGYFIWTFMDNFEWNFGYTKRCGLVHVDFATQQRTVKDSGRWYSDLCRNRELRI